MQRQSAFLPPVPRIVVYGLAVSDNRGILRFFFVGGLFRAPGFGVNEHVVWLRRMHPALSHHLSLLESNPACSVRALILRECDAQAERTATPFKAQLDDNVRFETIHLIRAGHTLLNLRYGTPTDRATLIADVVGSAILHANDLADRRELLTKRAAHRALRTSAIALLRKEWERGRHHGLSTRALCFLFSRAFPSAWRRLARLPKIELPTTGSTLGDALCMLMKQARAARVTVSTKPKAPKAASNRRAPALKTDGRSRSTATPVRTQRRDFLDTDGGDGRMSR